MKRLAGFSLLYMVLLICFIGGTVFASTELVENEEFKIIPDYMNPFLSIEEKVDTETRNRG